MKNDTTQATTCQSCNKSFEVSDWSFRYHNNGYKNHGKVVDISLCRSCKKGGRVSVSCALCQKKFDKDKNQVAKTKNNFCGKSCSAKYNNAHRKTGIRRSKAESYLEQLLITAGHTVKCNRRDLIPSGLEVDLYLPELNIAIELNGPVHYQPIYGQEKFNSIVSNDAKKAAELRDAGIHLYIIDVSQSRFSETQAILSEFATTLSA